MNNELVSVYSKKQLEILLEGVEHFPEPKITLEQYTLPAKVAAEILWYIQLRHKDISKSVVADLGCGTGILALGAALLNASYVVGIDLDREALRKALLSKQKLMLNNVDFVQGDIEHIPLKSGAVDVVIQNPPFGVHRRGIDIKFLRAAINIGKVVYSLHKRAPKSVNFISKTAEKLGAKVSEIYPISVELRPTYNFHYKKKHVVKADLFRLVKSYEC